MLLNKILSQLRNGKSIGIQEMADRLLEDTDAIKHAVTLLCELDYCEQITLLSRQSDCKKCCADSCASISGFRTNYWRLTYKGIGYLDRISE